MLGRRYFSVNQKELRKLRIEVSDLLRHHNLTHEHRQFDYENKIAVYNKETGDVFLKEEEKRVKKKVDFQGFQDEIKYMKEQLEVDDASIAEQTIEEAAVKIKEYQQFLDEISLDYSINPRDFYVSTKDFKRVDVGMIIRRPAIFMNQSKIDREFQVYRQKFMQEHWFDEAQYNDDFDELTKVSGDILKGNQTYSPTNRDNHPTHRDTETGEQYAYASKDWRKVDPTITDPKDFHFAASNSIYLVFKNKYTGEWEFPTKAMVYGQTFYQAREELFKELTSGWQVSHVGRAPEVATLRAFTEAETKNSRNDEFTGVRTYYYESIHKRGLPEMNLENSDWDEFEWVPRAYMNKYLNKERYEMFIDAMVTY